MVGLTRFELVTPRLSSVCSNQLSYRPRYSLKEPLPVLSKLDSACSHDTSNPDSQIDLRDVPTSSNERAWRFSRKEVIQPQVLLQLPCYDFTPITDHTLSGCVPCGFAHRFLVQPTFVM